MLRASSADALSLHRADATPHGAASEQLLIDAASHRAAGPLLEAMLHDVRNPLNALSINLEVLNEKLKIPTGVVPPGPEKNLRAMREQLQRVDALLRKFVDFLHTSPSGELSSNVSEVVERTLEVLGPELRRRRLQLQLELEPNVRIAADPETCRFILAQVVLKVAHASRLASPVTLRLARVEGYALLELEAQQVEPAGESFDDGAVDAAIASTAARIGGRAELRWGGACVRLPLTAA